MVQKTTKDVLEQTAKTVQFSVATPRKHKIADVAQESTPEEVAVERVPEEVRGIGGVLSVANVAQPRDAEKSEGGGEKRPGSAEREEDPESIHTSKVSWECVDGSGPSQSSGRADRQSSSVETSNQTLDPCSSIKSATRRTMRASKSAVPSAAKKAW